MMKQNIKPPDITHRPNPTTFSRKNETPIHILSSTATAACQL